MESTERYETQFLDYERPLFNIENSDLEKEQTEVKHITSLNAPVYNVEMFEEQYLERQIIEDIDMQNASLSILKDDCNLKVGIDHRLKFNLASLNESIREEESNDLKEDRANLSLGNKYENAFENTNPSFDSFLNMSENVQKLKINNFGLPHEITEIIDTSLCDDLSEKIDTVSLTQSNNFTINNDLDNKINIHDKTNLIRNSEISAEINLEQCERFSVEEIDYLRPVQNRQPDELINAQNSQTLILSAASNTELNTSLKNVENLQQEEYLIESKAFVNKEANNLTSLERIDVVQSINMPNTIEIEHTEENLKEFRNDTFADRERPFISKEHNYITSAEVKLISLLNAPKNENLTESISEKVENLFIDTQTEKSILTKEIIETNSAKSESIQFLNAPKNENINENNVEKVDKLMLETLIEKSVVSKETTEISSAQANSVSFLNAPKNENLNEGLVEKIEFLNIKNNSETLAVENEILLTNLVNVAEPAKPRMKEMEEIIEASFSENVNDLDVTIPIETVDYQSEIINLNSRPDKQLLFWLNYPKMITNHNQLEQARDIDEKMDFLYERIVHNSSRYRSDTDLETDTSLVQIEKVLSLFISNQEHVEFREEILKYLPSSRPELQELILNREILKLDDKLIINPEPVKLTSAKITQNLSFDEDSIEELSEQKYNLNMKKTLIKQEPFLLKKLPNTQNFHLIENAENFITNAINDLTNKSRIATQIDEAKHRIKSESNTVFNLAALASFFNPSETLKEFIENDIKSNSLQPTLVSSDISVNKVTQQTILNAPKSTRLEQDMEETWELVPKEEATNQQNLNIRDLSQNLNKACTRSDLVFWENLQEKSASSAVEQKLKEKVVENLKLDAALQEEILLDENLSKIEEKNNSEENVEPKTSNSLDLDSIFSIRQPKFNCDTKSLSICWDEQEIEFFTSTQNKNLDEIEMSEHDNDMLHENTLSINTDDDAGSFFEQIDKFETVTKHENAPLLNKADLKEHPVTYNRGKLVNNSCIEEENSNFSASSFQNHIPEVKTEDKRLNCLVEQIETNKWEKTDDLSHLKDIKEFTEIKIQSEMNDSQSEDEMDRSGSSSSENSSDKMHLIESVEILTNPNNELIHIQKVDINRLKIKEKSNDAKNDQKPRFKVDFKQEELVDLRSNEDEPLEMTTNKIFARKFVEQIIKLSSSKLENQIDSDTSDTQDESMRHSEEINFHNITTKTTSEILESLNNLKGDIGKHFTDSMFTDHQKSRVNSTEYLELNSEYNNIVDSDRCYDLNLACEFDQEQETTHEEDDFFEDVLNRLHSSSNFDKNEENLEIDEFNSNHNFNNYSAIERRVPIESEVEQAVNLRNTNDLKVRYKSSCNRNS